MFLIESMDCVFAKNQGKAGAGGSWSFKSTSDSPSVSGQSLCLLCHLVLTESITL